MDSIFAHVQPRIDLLKPAKLSSDIYYGDMLEL